MRHIIVDHVRNTLNIQATGHNISPDQDINLTFLQFINDLFTIILGDITIKCCGGITTRLQFLGKLDPDTEVLWVGLGSNLLVRDGGIRGQVVAPLNALKQIRLDADSGVYVECGVSCAKLAKFCGKHDLAGADFFAGIPGTIGGALAMNAGAFGGETWTAVERVLMIDPHREWFAAAHFRFALRAEGEQSDIRELLRRRNETQPIGLPSCGSVFKNPEGGHAAKLIEEAGLKGFRLGSAAVSDKHANFIISDEATTSQDVEALIEHIRACVEERFGIRLEPEVRIVGERA